MFRSLNKAFEKKIAILDKYQNKDKSIKEVLKEYFTKEFGENLKGFSFVLNYNSKDNSLIISTESKIIANELAIRLVAIGEFLKSRSIKLDRILIR